MQTEMISGRKCFVVLVWTVEPLYELEVLWPAKN